MLNYSWSLAYSSAMLETTPEADKIVQKICETEHAIFLRSQDVGLEFHEVQAMGDAAMALQSLRENRLATQR
jgi:hypothetical protein